MPYEKTPEDVKKFTSFLPAHTSRRIRMYHYENLLGYVPKCEFTGENCWFSNSGYHGVNRFLFENLIKHDLQIKFIPLRYMNLLRGGGSPEELIRLRDNRFFHKVRKDFSNCSSSEDIFERLVEDGFNEKSAREIINDLDFNLWSKLKEFIDRYYSLTSGVKNNHSRFYEIRGMSHHEAVNRLHDAMNTWEKIKYKTNDRVWYEKWCESRRAGLLAQSGRSSKHEIELFDKLSCNFNVRSHTLVSLKDIDLECRGLVKNKFRCYPDISLEDVIIEFHGSYWHHDFVEYPARFTSEEYLKEISKLKCIQAASGKRVFVVWESDFKKLKIDAIMTMIKEFITNPESNFGSTRELDYPIFESLQ